MTDSGSVGYCGRCQEPIADGVVVYCPACGALHHHRCWIQHNGCATPGCGVSAGQMTAPEPAASAEEPRSQQLPGANGPPCRDLVQELTEQPSESTATSGHRRSGRGGLVAVILLIVTAGIVLVAVLVNRNETNKRRMAEAYSQQRDAQTWLDSAQHAWAPEYASAVYSQAFDAMAEANGFIATGKWVDAASRAGLAQMYAREAADSAVRNRTAQARTRPLKLIDIKLRNWSPSRGYLTGSQTSFGRSGLCFVDWTATFVNVLYRLQGCHVHYNVRIAGPNGLEFNSSHSPSGFTLADSAWAGPGDSLVSYNEGWGNKDGGHFREGSYVLTLYVDGDSVGAVRFVVYPGSLSAPTAKPPRRGK